MFLIGFLMFFELISAWFYSMCAFLLLQKMPVHVNPRVTKDLNTPFHPMDCNIVFPMFQW
jgi:hypothetical protein